MRDSAGQKTGQAGDGGGGGRAGKGGGCRPGKAKAAGKHGSGRPGGGGWHPPIGDEAKGRFLAALKRGLSMEEAARSAGRSPGGFWKARQRDPAFDEAVAEMLELSNTPHFVAPGNGRRWQLRRIRRLRFVAWRKQVFLAHLAGTCDLTAAAEAAGVSPATVYRHLARDPDFAAAFQAALALGYPLLEAEALRQRLAAQRLLREGRLPEGEIPREFERVLQLLQRWDRRNGQVGPRQVSPGRRQPMSFAQAIAELDRYLAALGIPLAGAEKQGRRDGPGKEDPDRNDGEEDPDRHSGEEDPDRDNGKDKPGRDDGNNNSHPGESRDP